MDSHFRQEEHYFEKQEKDRSNRCRQEERHSKGIGESWQEEVHL